MAITKASALFPDTLHTHIESRYYQDADIASLEEDYISAGIVLQQQLSVPYQAQLRQLERLFAEQSRRAAEWGYWNGLFTGISGAATYPPDEHIYLQHPALMPLISQCNRLYELLYHAVPHNLQEAVATIGCRWDQRVYSAWLDGYAFGKNSAK